MSARGFQCPDCGLALAQQHPAHALLVCNCGRAWQVFNGQLLPSAITGTPKDVKPWFIRMGATGTAPTGSFTVTGRVLARAADSLFQYWTIVYDGGGETGLLAEGYGMFSILKDVVLPAGTLLEKAQATQPGGLIIGTAGESFQLIRKIQYPLFQAEGSCWWPAKTASFSSVELYKSATGEAFEMLQFEGESPRSFRRESFHVSELNFRNTVALPAPPETACLSCGKPQKLQLWPYTHTLECSNCGGFQARNFLNNAWSKTTGYPKSGLYALRVGQTVFLDDTHYRITGIATKREADDEDNVWDEYTLYHPSAGIGYLSNFEDVWTYVKEWPDPPVDEPDEDEGFEYDDRWFEPYNAYRYRVLQAAGEHLYNLDSAVENDCSEFTHDDNTLICERNAQEQVWFYGTELSDEDVEELTAGQEAAPEQDAIQYATEQKMTEMGASNSQFEAVYSFTYTHGSEAWKAEAKTIKRLKKAEEKRIQTVRGQIFLFLMAALIAVHTITTWTNDRMQVAEVELLLPGAQKAEVNSEVFKLDRTNNNLKLEISAPLENNWVYLEGTLQNQANGQQYFFSKTLEYYHGYEGGESWSEGDRDGSLYLNNLPAGNYQLMIEAQTDSTKTAGNPELIKLVAKKNVGRISVAIWTAIVFGAIVFFTFPTRSSTRSHRKRLYQSS